MKFSSVTNLSELRSLAIVLVFALLIAFPTIPLAAATASLSGSNIRVTTANYALDVAKGYGASSGAPDVFQQNEPSVAVNPSSSSTLAVGVNDVRSIPLTGDAWQSLAFSTNTGTTWSESLIPGFPGDSGCPSVSPICGNGAASDPYVAFDTSNNLFFAFIAFQRAVPAEQPGTTPAQSNAIAVAKYNGVTGAYVKTVIVDLGTLGAGQQQDKEALAVDTASSSFKDNVYVSWSKFTGNFDHLYFARSTNHGDSYSNAIKLDDGSPLIQASSIAVAPDGTVYVAYRKYNLNPVTGTPQSDAIYVVKSTNGGVTFSKPKLVQFIQDYSQSASRSPPVFRVSTFPWIAADANGVYVVWSNKNPSTGADVEVRRSKTGGATWETAVILGGTGHQIMPTIVAAGGTLSVAWYDSRSEPNFNANGPVSNGTTTGMEVFYSQADTTAAGPLAFDTPIAVTSAPFNPNLDGSILARTPFIGDYIGIAATSTTAFVVWTDNRDINNTGNINGQLFQSTDTLPCYYPCSSLPTSLINQRAVDSNVYFQAITK